MWRLDGKVPGRQLSPGVKMIETGKRIDPLACPFGREQGIRHQPGGLQQAALSGHTAALVIDDRLSILLTSKPGFTHDPAAFLSQGIDVTAQDFVVVKSGYHFKLNFAGIGTPVSVATP